MRCFLLWIMTFTIIGASLAFAEADNAEKASDLLKEKIDLVLSVLEEEELADSEKKQRIMEIVEPIIDFGLMAKLSLGRTSWGRLSESEQEKFIGIFVERLKNSYLDKTTLYSDQEMAFSESRGQGSKVYVPMEIIAGDEIVDVLYKFYPSRDGLKVYDVEINGVSLIKSYRSQFDEILQNGSVQDLFEELEDPGKP